MRTISNQKYEITDMAHEEYPFLTYSKISLYEYSILIPNSRKE